MKPNHEGASFEEDVGRRFAGRWLRMVDRAGYTRRAGRAAFAARARSTTLGVGMAEAIDGELDLIAVGAHRTTWKSLAEGRWPAWRKGYRVGIVDLTDGESRRHYTR